MMLRITTYISCALLIIILLCSVAVSAQQVTDSLPAVKVHGRHKQKTWNDLRINDFTPGQKKTILDSAALQQYQLQSVANVLSQQTSVFIKSYGFNSLATLNIRGSSAAQSQVLWNGVPIQNAALGIADVSQLPVMLMNNVSMVYGSSAALLGSGNVGGSLMLENDVPVFDSLGKKKIIVSAGGGSYGQYMGGIKAAINNKKWFFSLSAFGQSSQNDFSYSVNGVEKKLTNSQLQSSALLLQAAYKINKTDVLSIYTWYQHYKRHIPPAFFETGSVKEQTDIAARFLLEWKRHTRNNEWFAKAAFIKDDSRYKDDAILLEASLPVYQYYFDAGWKHTINANSNLLIFSPIQVSWANYNNTTQQQHKAAIAAAYNIKLFNTKLDIAANAREEIIDDKAIFSPGINASYALTDWLLLRANMQHTYRSPNLNELYFFPGGNTSLKPEQGWNEDAGYELHFNIGSNISFKQDVSVFNRNIQDWIIWFGGSIWTPHNISEVWSRGVETDNLLTWQLNHWQLHIGVNTSYVLATTTSSYVQNDGSMDKQLPYTPRYNGRLNLGFVYKHLSFNYSHTYTGYRFVTTDESEYIPPYSTCNIQLLYDMEWNKHLISLNGQVNNIWNEDYQVVAFRPMPGANWLLGFKLAL